MTPCAFYMLNKTPPVIEYVHGGNECLASANRSHHMAISEGHNTEGTL